MIQDIIVFVLFLAAIAYTGYLVYKSFNPDAGCPSGCGSCGIDIQKIRKELA